MLQFINWVTLNVSFSGSLLCPSCEKSHIADQQYMPRQHPADPDGWPFPQQGLATCTGYRSGWRGRFILDNYNFICLIVGSTSASMVYNNYVSPVII